jgi:hypothetical protein
MSKNTHTALKDAARELADVEGLSYAEARRIVERWAAHQGPTDDELRAADETDFDPLFWYATQPPSEVPGFLMRMHDYPERSDGPAKFCYPHAVQSLADPEKEAVLSLTARPDVYYGEPALVVEPLTFTPHPALSPASATGATAGPSTSTTPASSTGSATSPPPAGRQPSPAAPSRPRPPRCASRTRTATSSSTRRRPSRPTGSRGSAATRRACRWCAGPARAGRCPRASTTPSTSPIYWTPSTWSRPVSPSP